MVDAEGGKEQNEKARSKHDIQNHVRNAVVGKVPQHPRLAEWLNMIEHALTITFENKKAESLETYLPEMRLNVKKGGGLHYVERTFKRLQQKNVSCCMHTAATRTRRDGGNGTMIMKSIHLGQVHQRFCRIRCKK